MLQAFFDSRREENSMRSLVGSYEEAENLERKKSRITASIQDLENCSQQLTADEVQIIFFSELMNRLILKYNETMTLQRLHDEYMTVLTQENENNSVLHRCSLQYPLLTQIFKMMSWVEHSNFTVSFGTYNLVLTYGSNFYTLFLKHNTNDVFGVMTSVGKIAAGMMAGMILLNLSAKMDNANHCTRKFRIEKFKEDRLLKYINNGLHGMYSLERPKLDSSIIRSQEPYWCKPLEYLDTFIDFRTNRIKYAMFLLMLLADNIICRAEHNTNNTYSYVMAVLVIVQFKLITYPSTMIFANRLDHALQDKAERNSRWVHETDVLEAVIEKTTETVSDAWNNTVRVSQSAFSYWNRSARASIEVQAEIESDEDDVALLIEDTDDQPRMSV